VACFLGEDMVQGFKAFIASRVICLVGAKSISGYRQTRNNVAEADVTLK
jgi:hypothetical protein